ncbi:MAG: hypothetical protein ACLU4N_28775 [Butyricimonas faecihominis]
METGGNPDVKPEDGYSYDASVAYRKQLYRGLFLDAEVSGYLMYIDNWIYGCRRRESMGLDTPESS